MTNAPRALETMFNPKMIPTHFDDLRALVLHTLHHPHSLDWTLQGFGMLRTYLRPEARLHVWHPGFKQEGVSDIHDHPWDFVSLVICGRVVNRRYERRAGAEYREQKILCGTGGGVVAELEPSANSSTGLLELELEDYGPGDQYSQLAAEVHRSSSIRGTVTLCRRTFGSDPDHASVFWHRDGEWGSAEPRKATEEEIAQICNAAAALLSADLHFPDVEIEKEPERELGAAEIHEVTASALLSPKIDLSPAGEDPDRIFELEGSPTCPHPDRDPASLMCAKCATEFSAFLDAKGLTP